MDWPTINLLHLELTNACNFRCEFCPLTVSTRNVEMMPIEMFQNIVDNVTTHNLAKKIQLHVLGEPLLYKEILTAISYATDKGLKVMLTTNGSLLNKETIIALSEAGLYSVDISLQFYDRNTHHSKLSKIEFKRYQEKILNAVSIIHQMTDMQLIVKLMNTKYKKFFSLPGSVEFEQKGRKFREIVIRLIIDIYNTIGLDGSKELIVEKLQRENLDSPKRIKLAEKLFVFVQLFMDWGNAFTEDKVYPAKYGRCSFAFSAPSVLSDGRVLICCGDYDGKTCIGNVNQRPFNEIIHNSEAQRLLAGFRRNRLLHSQCQRCLGATNPVLALSKGLGSIFVEKFLNLEGANKVVSLV